MGEHNNSIDKLFREQLADHEMDVPMHLLDGILATKNKKRGLWWWSAGILLLIVAGAVIFNLTQPNEHLMIASNDASQITSKKLSKKTKITRSGSQPKIATNRADILANEVPTSGKVNKITLQKSNVTPKKEPVIQDNFVSKKEGAQKSVSGGQLAHAGAITPLIEAAREVTIAKSENVPHLRKSLLSKSTNETAKKLNMLDNYLVASIASGQASLASNAPPQVIPQKTDCNEFGKLYSGIYAEIGASFDVAQRRFYTNDEINDSYLEVRESSEQQSYAYSVGLHLSALSKSGWSMTSGFDYHQIGERFIYQDGFKTIFIIEEIKDGEGNVIGRDTISKSVPRILTENNKYHLAQVPFLLGFEVNSQNFSMGVYGGPLLNVLFRQETKFLSPEELVATDYSNNDTVFRKSLGIGWRIGLEFGYRISGRHQITFQPYVQFNPKSFTQNDFPIQQKYYITGLRLGWKTKIW